MRINNQSNKVASNNYTLILFLEFFPFKFYPLKAFQLSVKPTFKMIFKTPKRSFKCLQIRLVVVTKKPALKVV